MSEHNITVTGGTSTRLKTAGKYCDRDIIVTATGGSGESDPYFLFPYVQAIRLTNLDIFNVSDLVIDSDTLVNINQFAFNATNTKVTSITFNTPPIKGIIQAFCNQKNLKTINFPTDSSNTEFIGVSVTGSSGAFQGCSNLETITGKLSIAGTSSTSNKQAFEGCSALVDLILENECLKSSISFEDSPNLNTKSRASIILALADLTGGTAQTLTVHATVGEQLNDTQKTQITKYNWILVY